MANVPYHIPFDCLSYLHENIRTDGGNSECRQQGLLSDLIITFDNSNSVVNSLENK